MTQYTKEGFKKLQDELAERKTTITAEITLQLEEARAQGDLSENSEYDEAKDRQAANAQRIKELEDALKDAEIIDDESIDKTKVSLGSTVTVRDESTKEEEIYIMVNSKEEDIFSGKMSVESPLGQALVGHKKGKTVEVTTNAGTFKYKIIKIGK